MSLDLATLALMEDVDRVRALIARQLADDATHEVALAMFEADYRRAQRRLADHIAARPQLAARFDLLERRLAA